MDYESAVDLDEDNNLDAKGGYIKCVNCGYKLKAIEKYDDILNLISKKDHIALYCRLMNNQAKCFIRLAEKTQSTTRSKTYLNKAIMYIDNALSFSS